MTGLITRYTGDMMSTVPISPDTPPFANLGPSEWIALGALAVSVFALVYSRKAYHFQRTVHEERHVSALRLVVSEERVRLENPADAAILRISGRLYYKYLGTYGISLAPNSDRSRSYRLIATPQSKLASRVPKRVSRQAAAAEVFVEDIDGIVWFMNSAGARIKWPKGRALGALAKCVTPLRSFPFWTRFNVYDWGSCVVSISIAAMYAVFLLAEPSTTFERFFQEIRQAIEQMERR
jgi:hypothetical protein